MMEKELPEGWKLIQIGDLTKIVSGGTPSTIIKDNFDGDIPWITPADLSGYKKKYISNGRKYITSLGLKNSSARLIPKNSVLFSSRAPIGYVAIAANELCTNQGFKSLIPNDSYESSYAYYYLKSIKELAESEASGTTFKELSGSKMALLPFPLPPLAEQKRIVAKLDMAFGYLETLKASLTRIPELLKTFRQSVLTQAVTGKLTSITPSLISLDLIADIIDPHPSHRTPPQEINGIPYVSIGDIRGDKTIDFDGARKVSQQVLYDHKKRYELKEGDFIFGKIGTLGKPVLLPIFITTNYVLSANVILVQPNELCFDKFLYYYMSSPIIDKLMKDGSNATSQAAFGIKKARNIQINLPTITEQQEIVARIEVLFSKADAIESQYHSLKEKIDKLPQALLAKGFRGELVPQDPDDEPASVLLEKIQMEMGGLGKKGKKQMELVFED